jgi:hypothetical protein
MGPIAKIMLLVGVGFGLVALGLQIELPSWYWLVPAFGALVSVKRWRDNNVRGYRNGLDARGRPKKPRYHNP